MLVPVGLLAGYAYATKYTAFVMVLFAVGFVMWRARKIRPVATVVLFSSLMIAPWMLKDWIVVQNPIAPFGNAIFRNPYFYPASEKSYADFLRSYEVTDKRTLPLEVTTTSLPAATGGVPYSATLTADGGVRPYTWSVTSGSLPPGMTLDSFTGVISGTSDVTGTYQFMVTVADSEHPRMTASAVLSISVSGPVITAVRPENGPDFGGTPVMITGTGLACPPNDGSCTVQVTFGGHSAQVEWAHADQIAVVSPPGSGTVTITVTVAGVSSQATNADLFGYSSAF